MWDLRKFASRTAAIAEDGRCYTYGELADFTADLGPRFDDRALVFCLCDNSIGGFIGYLTCLQANTVPVMLDAGIDASLLSELIDSYKPKWIWLPQARVGDIAAYSHAHGAFEYALLLADTVETYPIDDALCLLASTSGSTGSPKFVRQSRANILANTDSIVEYLDMNKDDVSITNLPMNYTYGMSVINSHIRVGGRIVFTNVSIMQKAFWSLFEEHRVTNFNGVPFTYEMLDKLKFFKRDYPSVRMLTQAGGKLNETLQEKVARYAAETDKAFFVMYGQAEATTRISYLPSAKCLEKIGSVGIPIPGGVLSIVDDEGHEVLGTDETGTFVYSGPNVCLGYATSRFDLANGDEWNGVLVTGDLGKRDEDGYFYITGRKKRYVKVLGLRVSLDELEHIAKGQFPGVDVACTGDDRNIFVFHDTAERERDIHNALAAKTHLNRSVFRMRYLEHIPKLASGKTDYVSLP